MAIEIERKFLVSDATFLSGRQGVPIVQGYLAKAPMTIRVRVMGEQGFLTLKGPSHGCARDEFEYPIPLHDAYAMLDCYCRRFRIYKTRYEIPYGGHVFEVDVFHGPLAGLVVAEVELLSEGEAVAIPPWLDREVTGDPRYGNYALAQLHELAPSACCPKAAAAPPGDALA